MVGPYKVITLCGSTLSEIEYGEYDEPAPQEVGLSFEAGLEPGV